jgi:Putative heavy-metal-binding
MQPLLFLYVAVSVTACGRAGGTPVTPATPTSAASIAIYAAAEPQTRESPLGSDATPTPYSICGFVSAIATSPDELMERLREQAALLGAHAIVGLRITTSSGNWVLAYGTAVRWS